MNQIERAIIIVLDSVGIGELPDADKYGDEGSNTLGNCARAVGGLNMPHLAVMGLGRLGDFQGISAAANPSGAYGKMVCRSAGKDTTTGHWEISGLILDRPFPVYPQGFPPDVINEFLARTGARQVLGNKVASGTEIIKELGEEHMRTGWPIVYTSADSVFQIAAHEEIIPIERLYEMCRAARSILTGEHAVGRVIARPFEGQPGSFVRTERRHDFSIKPPGPNILTRMSEAGYPVLSVGKINDIFAGVGITGAIPSHKNKEGTDSTIKLIREGEKKGLIFTNLVDFDMLYGHRNDPNGYASALEEFDRRLPEITGSMGKKDLLIITADHGCDPTTESTDHSREYVPLIVYGEAVRAGADLGTRNSFADIAATLAEIFKLPSDVGQSFAGAILT